MHISWWTLAIQGVNFLVLVWLLQRFLYRPVQDVIEKRRLLGQQAASKAQNAKSEAEALKLRYEQALAGIEAERQASLERARAAGEAERLKVLQHAREEAAERVGNAQENIDKDRAKALASVREEVADLAVKLAATLLADLARSIPNEAILARLEADLARMAPAERRRFDDEIAANGASLCIVTARALEPDEKRGWQSRLEHVFDHRLHVTFAEDPSLLAGAVLRLPHTAVNATWADQLARAREALMRGSGGHDQ
jgi:F-type H+-transporting ATPase subunit b